MSICSKQIIQTVLTTSRFRESTTLLLLRISRTRKKIHQIKRLRTLKKGSELSVLTALSHLSKGESSTKWAKISKKAQFREVENSVPIRIKSKAIR